MEHAASAVAEPLAPPFTFGGVTFRLESVERRVFSEVCTASVTLLSDGTELRSFGSGGQRYLLIDHRGDPSRTARVELWRPTVTPELPVAGLYVLCEALAG